MWGGGHGPLRVTVHCDAVTRGGAEVVTGHLLAALDPSIDVTVTGAERDVVTWLAGHRPGTPAVVVPAVRVKRDAGAVLALRRALAATRPDVIHVQLDTITACRYSVLVASTLPARVVVTIHSLLAPATPFGMALSRIAARRADAIVAVGTAAAREIEHRLGLRAGRVRVVHNGVPAASTPRPATGGRHPAGPVPRLGWAGRMDPAKGVDVLLRALVSVPGATLELVGDGPERAGLEALARALALDDRVRFTGWTEDMAAAYDRFDVFVLPSRTEAFPLTVLEAMAAGVAVVATDVGSVGEAIVDGTSGLLVRPDDAGALAGALTRVLRDDGLRRALAAQGANAVRAFSAGEMADRYEGLYRAPAGERYEPPQTG
jgi:glycosyltransferase involved in cell wall biosynthesis